MAAQVATLLPAGSSRRLNSSHQLLLEGLREGQARRAAPHVQRVRLSVPCVRDALQPTCSCWSLVPRQAAPAAGSQVVVVRRVRSGALLLMHLVGDTVIPPATPPDSEPNDAGGGDAAAGGDLAARKQQLQKQKHRLRRDVDWLREQVSVPRNEPPPQREPFVFYHADQPESS